MKIVKRITSVIIVAVLLLSFTGCCMEHEWVPATCVDPCKCAKCGKVKNESLAEHTWKAATCTVPKTCSVCGKTEGKCIPHNTGDWQKEDELVFGGYEYKTCSICNKKVETRVGGHNEKTDLGLSLENGLSMSRKEFAEYLANYLPDDTIACVYDKYNDEYWGSGCIAITNIDGNIDNQYVRLWYSDEYFLDELYKQHFDAYFDDPKDFLHIASGLFEAIEPEYVKNNDMEKNLSEISDWIYCKNTNEYVMTMNNGVFICSYTDPYSIFDKWYPGFYEIRYISKQFYKEIY